MSKKLKSLDALERSELDLSRIMYRLGLFSKCLAKGEQYTKYHSESCMLQMERLSALCDIIQSTLGDLHNKIYTTENRTNNIMSPWEFLQINQ